MYVSSQQLYYNWKLQHIHTIITFVSKLLSFAMLKIKKKRLKNYKFFLITRLFTWNNLQTFSARSNNIAQFHFMCTKYCDCAKQEFSLSCVSRNSRFDKQLHICKCVDIFDRHKASVIPRGIAKWEEKGKRERDSRFW